MSQNGQKPSLFMTSLTKNWMPKPKNFFSLQPRRPAKILRVWTAL